MTSCRVAIQAGHAGIFIVIFIRMLVIHFCLVMLMAIDAGKKRIIGGIAVTVGAIVPFIIMRSRVYGEKLGIMYGEISGFPAGQSCMTFQAGGRYVRSHMIGIGRGIIIRFMTGEAICRNIGIVRPGMAAVTII